MGNKGLNFTIYCMSLLHASTASRQLGNAPAVLARAGVLEPIGDDKKKRGPLPVASTLQALSAIAVHCPVHIYRLL
jgi:hypothetical protein